MTTDSQTTKSTTTKALATTATEKTEKPRFNSTITGGLTVEGFEDQADLCNGYMSLNGAVYAVRNCYARGKDKRHDPANPVPHIWKSYLLEYKNGTSSNAVCDGTGQTAEYRAGVTNSSSTYTTTYTTTYTAPKKKNYSTGWRMEYVTPINVKEARAIAYDMHRNDVDKINKPYWKHLEAVAAGISIFGGDNEEVIAALFHDAEEDGHTTFKHLQEIGVSAKSLVIIEAVSKRISEEQSKYMNRVMTAGEVIPKVLEDLGITTDTPGVSEAKEGAMRVKLSDLLNNTRHDRMAKVKVIKGEYTVKRLLKKYRPFIATLMMELGIIATEQGQKDLDKIATKPVGTATSTTTYYGGTGSSTSASTNKTGTSDTGTAYKTNAKPAKFSLLALYCGDWPENWPAPVIECVTDKSIKNKADTLELDFLLANGEIFTAPSRKRAGGGATATIQVPTWTFMQWSTVATIWPSDESSENDILDYMKAIQEVKEARGAGDANPYDDTLSEWSGI